MKITKIGIVGCGTIGTSIANMVCRDFKKKAVLAFLCETDPEKAVRLKKMLGLKIPVVPLSRLIRRSDLVIEAASAEISGSIARETLRLHKQAVIMSTGGLLSSRAWRKAARSSRGKIWIPSGAVAGVDGILAAREGGIRKIRLVTRKPPASLRQAPYFRKRRFPSLRNGKEHCLFRGSAAKAILAFPQNINVAAILSLAGMGGERTGVEIWTSRRYAANRHEIYMEGECGTLNTVTVNLPSKINPKTSALAVYSARAVLRKIFSPLQIGT